MSKTLLELAHQLTEAGEPFVLATVVWCERPTSAKPGAQALIQANEQVTGWIGGSCAQPIVMREAARILREWEVPNAASARFRAKVPRSAMVVIMSCLESEQARCPSLVTTPRRDARFLHLVARRRL